MPRKKTREPRFGQDERREAGFDARMHEMGIDQRRTHHTIRWSANQLHLPDCFSITRQPSNFTTQSTVAAEPAVSFLYINYETNKESTAVGITKMHQVTSAARETLYWRELFGEFQTVVVRRIAILVNCQLNKNLGSSDNYRRGAKCQGWQGVDQPTKIRQCTLSCIISRSRTVRPSTVSICSSITSLDLSLPVFVAKSHGCSSE